MSSVVVSTRKTRSSNLGRSAKESVQLTDITEQARANPSYDGHELVVSVIDESCGLNALIALHDHTLGPALGGCRMWPYKTDAEAMTDVLRLSRGMTLKAAMAGVPTGGGKAVIIGDSHTAKSEELFRAFGRALNGLGGRYITGEDVGIAIEDIDFIAAESPFVLGGGEKVIDPSPTTAYGVYIGITRAVRHRLGRDDIGGLTVAVQGLGHVGYSLCEQLHAAGARLIVTDIDAEAAARAAKQFGAARVAPDGIYTADADVYAPCALGATLNDDTVPRLTATVVAGSANNQLLLDRHGEMLAERNILYAPDYVINAGGLIAIALERTPEGYDEERARRLTAAIGDTLDEIFARAGAEGTATNRIADTIAFERIERAAGRTE